MQYPSIFTSLSASLFSRKTALTLAAGAAIALGVAAVPVHAQSQIPDRTGLRGGSVLDWSQAGPELTDLPSPTTLTDTAGRSVAVTSDAGGDFERRDQSTSWNGSFTPGDALLWNQGSGPVTFAFTSGVRGLGTQIMPDYWGDYTAQLQTFGQNGALLSTFTANGNSNGSGDNSAVFLGVLDPTADIYAATYSLTAASYAPEDFAVNSVSIAPAAVPETSTTLSFGLLLVLGMGGIVVAAKRKKTANPSA